MSQITEVSTDVLVIGGGIAGLCAANKAADEGADVLITEKSNASCCGQLPTAGGGISLHRGIPPFNNEEHIKTLIEEGEYLNDQEWTESYVSNTFKSIQEIAEWGVPFATDMDGKIELDGYNSVRCIRPEMCNQVLLGRAMDKGAKVLNKMYMVSLLKHDGRVVGAVGFHYQTGDFYVIKSKATIIATGGCNYKCARFLHMDCGEGVAMAYNAGAELRNTEFCNTFIGIDKYSFGRKQARLINFLENALGENMIEKYPEMDQPRIHFNNFRKTVLAFYREIEAGRGPIYLNLTKHPELVKSSYIVQGARPMDLCMGYANMLRRSDIDLREDKLEYKIMPEFHAGPIRIDLNSETTVPGLYAVGDAIQNGCGFVGAYEAGALPLGPLGLCIVTGLRAGAAAGKAIADTPKPEVSTDETDKLKAEIFAPLGVKEGYDPYNLIEEIQEIVFKFANSYVKHQDRLEKALEKIEEIKDKLSKVTAKDSHELVRCNEAKSMIICAEALFRASLMRKETRGSNIREDYPERDDDNWLKWIIVKKENDKINLRAEPVPIEKYKYKPD